jgi:hypothetical protein
MSGTCGRLPVAMTSLSYGVTSPVSAKTSFAYRSTRVTRVPACSRMPFSSYQDRLLRKMPASSSAPLSTLDSRIRL